MEHSDYIVYVDESGDHNLAANDPEYPVFVLAFCIFERDTYTQQITPAMQAFKFNHFGHDMVVLHEHELRKAEPPFDFLRTESRRVEFFTDLNRLVNTANFTLIAAVIDKLSLEKTHFVASNPYDLAMRFGLERVHKYLTGQGQGERRTHVVFEARGKKEDNELELEFRRVCGGLNYQSEQLPFDIVLAHKQVNSCGLQLADLVARPIGRKVLNPAQANRAYDILEKKFDRSPSGSIRGWGLKKYP